MAFLVFFCVRDTAASQPADST